MSKRDIFEFIIDIVLIVTAVVFGYWIGAIIYVAFSTYFNMMGIGKVLHKQITKIKEKLENV